MTNDNAIINSQELTSEQELVTATTEQITDKRDDVASSTDTGYETGSVASALNLSQITKVIKVEC